MTYIWQQAAWPNFKYETTGIRQQILQFTEKTGRIDGLLSALPSSLQTDTIVELMVGEALKSSEIEGEMLSRPDVLSSVRNNLGLNTETTQVGDRRAKGIAELMVAVRESHATPLSQDLLLKWHAVLMQGARGVAGGAWRTHSEPMLILSGTIGNERIHYEAPPSKQVPGEMRSFVRWFNNTAPGAELEILLAPVRSAIAHLYFESIHPFEDGNGRIGRALSEKALSEGVGRPVLLSLSHSIEADRAGYYAALKEAQHTGGATRWVEWFVNMLLDAQSRAELEIEFTLKKTKLFDRITDQVNLRQLKVVRRMLKGGPAGFEGGMTAKKYMGITRTSKPTATRDLQDLAAKGILVAVGGGRSTHYLLCL